LFYIPVNSNHTTHLEKSRDAECTVCVVQATVCLANQFMCDNGARCIPLEWQCDGQSECDDGADEKDCETNTCLSTEFRCNSGKCIPSTWYCDGDPDCDNMEDEVPNCNAGELNSSNHKSFFSANILRKSELCGAGKPKISITGNVVCKVQLSCFGSSTPYRQIIYLLFILGMFPSIFILMYALTQMLKCHHLFGSFPSVFTLNQ